MVLPLIVVLLPIAASGLIILLRRENVAGCVSLVGVCGATAAAAVQLAFVASGGDAKTTLSSFGVAGFVINLQLQSDVLGSTVAMLVSSICALVIAYSIAYMRDEHARTRYFAMISLFTGSMLVLVLAADYLTLYVSWELVGFCSYMLIGQYSQRRDAAGASLKAFLTTRIADLGLLLGIALLFATFGSVSFETIFRAANSGLAHPAVTAVAFLILMGALGKSAQLPFHFWLPDAMAGPTPVSALLHSATMVAAGIFLIVRSWPLFQLVPDALRLLLVLTSVTAIFAAVAACAQEDIKRLLAYSTISQIGEMGMALGIGSAAGGTFHLLTHGTFKALLFLSVGIVTKIAGTQWLREIASTNGRARLGFLIGALSLAAIPPLGGYWSKEAMTSAAPGWTRIVYLMLSLLSALYIGRAYFLVFRPEYRRKDVNSGFTVPVFLLAGATSLIGILIVPFSHGWLGTLGRTGIPAMTGTVVIHLALAGFGWAIAWNYYRRENPVWAGVLQWNGWASRMLLGGFGTDAVPRWFALTAQKAASATSSFDAAFFDRFASAVSSSVLRIADYSDHIDVTVFDRLAGAASVTTLRLAGYTNVVDEEIMDRPVVRSASNLGKMGARVRLLQTGRIYHYLTAIFAWVILTALITFLARII